MDKVSVRALQMAGAMARLANVPVAELMAGLRAAERLEDTEGSVTWDDFVVVWERLVSRLPSDEALPALAGEVTLVTPQGSLVAQMKEACATPQAAYELFARFSGPAHFHPVRFHVADWGDGTLTFSAHITTEMAPSRPFLLTCEGVLVQWPTLLGFSAAHVRRVRITDRQGEWFITVPSGAMREPQARAQEVFAQLSAQGATLLHALDDLQATDRDFRNTLEALPLLVGVHEAGVLRWVNRAFGAPWGWTPQELVGRSVRSLLAAAGEALEPALARRGGGWVAVSLEARDGPVHLRVRSGGEVFFGGRAGTLLVGVDLTSEAQARRRAARSELTLAAVLGALPELVLHWDEGGRLVAVYGGSEMAEREDMQQYVGGTLRDMHERMGHLSNPIARQLRDFFELAQRTRQRLCFTHPGADPSGEPRVARARGVHERRHLHAHGLRVPALDAGARAQKALRRGAAHRAARAGARERARGGGRGVMTARQRGKPCGSAPRRPSGLLGGTWRVRAGSRRTASPPRTRGARCRPSGGW